jgi:serine/threonine protein kinase/Leucine-rich repeat (LRR) protein
MAADLESVIKQLTESSIIAQGKLENFIPPKADPKSVDELVQTLIKSENLTAFQGQQVKAGKARALILGTYTILDKIGAGGMGQVFKAQHRKLKRLVAIKMLPPSMTKDAAAIARFEREVEAAAKLRHPNLVGADDAAEANGVHFLVMEYVDGKDLSATVKKDGPLPVNKAVNYILQAARGLEFAHSEGVVHRDIKPANLLLDKKGVVKILDMGLARLDSSVGAESGPQADLTGTGTIMGTVDYMAPEQALDTKHADARADIYSLGISLYFLLAGRAAFEGDTVMKKLLAHREQPIPSLQDTQTTVSKQLDAVFRKMVAKRVEDRYQTMSEVVEALERLGVGSSTTGGKGDVASTLDLSSADRKKLAAKTTKKPLGSLTEVVASEKTKHLVLKIIGGSFATIIAPILVTYLIKHLEKKDEPHNPPAVNAPATLPPVVVATNTTSPTTSPVATGGNAPWNTPEFRAWIKGVQAMPAGQQVIAVNKKLVELNPGFDGKATPNLERGMVTGLDFITEHVTDISPVRALAGLQSLTCNAAQKGNARSELFELSPLEGMKLTKLECANTEVFDLSPLHGMPLEALNVTGTKVTDLSPLHGLPLKALNMSSTKATDLSPLQGLPLASLMLVSTPVTGLSPLKGMSSLTTLSCQQCKQLADFLPLADCQALTLLKATTTKLTPAQVAALQKALPNCKIEWDDPAKATTQPNQPWNTPAFQAWVKDVQVMPAEQQIEAVSKKLMELNPGFDGKVTGYDGKGTPKVDKDVVMEIGFLTDNVTNISPVRALTGLKSLSCGLVNAAVKGKLSDLSPLQGMKLNWLACRNNPVSDLSPLRGMPLTKLTCCESQVADLSPLRGMLLTHLNCGYTQVADLSPLQGMPLESLHVLFTQVSDLSSVVGMHLKYLACHNTKVSKLTPLEGMPLTFMSCNNTQVSDLSPLKEMNLTDVWITPQNITKGMDVIRQLKSVKVIGLSTSQYWPVAEFWKRYDAGEFGKPAAKKLAYLDPAFQAWVKATQALPAEQQIEAVSKKLMELNPGFDGRMTGANGKGTPRIFNGVVNDMAIITDNVKDISPVRALAELKILICTGSSSSAARGKLADLSPLAGMPLIRLGCNSTAISDLSPLQGMPLTTLVCSETQISDLSPLEGMPLTDLSCGYTQVTDLTPLKDCNSLASLHVAKTKVTPAQVAALQRALPNCKIEWDDPANAAKKLAYLDPAFQQWVKATQALPAEQQIEAVSKKLMELNPGFDGKLAGGDGKGMPNVENGAVTTFAFAAADITDISPVRAFTKLQTLQIRAWPGGKSELSDLSPLAGMNLGSLVFGHTQVSNLSPLGGMRLTSLFCPNTPVSNLTPLQGMPLIYVDLNGTPISDLSPLRDSKSIRSLLCRDTKVADLTPLKEFGEFWLIDARNTEVTPAQVAALQKALPNCKIEWDDPTKASPASGVVVDLLARIDPKKNALTGEWILGPDGLLSPDKRVTWGLLRVPYEPPQEYHWDVEVEPKSENRNTFALFFSTNGNQGTVCLDGYTKPNISALEMIDGKPGNDGEASYKQPIFTFGKPSNVRVTVRKDGVTVVVDGKKILTWQGNPARFSIFGSWKVPDKKTLFVGSQSKYMIRKMTITPIEPGVMN